MFKFKIGIKLYEFVCGASKIAALYYLLRLFITYSDSLLLTFFPPAHHFVTYSDSLQAVPAVATSHLFITYWSSL